MKRILALLLCLLMTMSVMSAFAEIDGFVDGKFTATRKITVEIYDRNNDGGTDPTNNKFTDFIKKNMLEKYNVEVEYIPVPRWTEGEEMNNLLGADKAPDICVTYDYAMITTFAGMGGVIDLAPLVQEHIDLIPNVVNLLGMEYINFDLDPATGHLWAIEGRRLNDPGQHTFIREDWLKKLNLPVPTTLEEYTNTLIAFRDNAELLLGDDAAQMIPVMITQDVGWLTIEMAKAFVPNDVTDKDWYVYGYDDRGIMREGYKEAIRVVNDWYNKGLVWKDFALYGEGDNTHENLFKAGFVGAFTHSFDQPYRNGNNSYQVNMKKNLGDDTAAYIPIPVFKNDAGVYKKYYSPQVDRKVFFPHTNDEPIASLLYLDFITSPEALFYLQAGDVGINHNVTEDGAIQQIPAVAPDIVNSGNNIDYTMLNNGLHLGDPDLAAKSYALSYAGIDPSYIVAALDLSAYDVRNFAAPSCGNIAAEEGVGTALKEKRNNLLAKAVTCAPEEFDAIYDAGYADYLASGGQAIIDERAEAWTRTHGDKLMLD